MELTIHYQVCIRSLETEATWTYLQVPSCVFLTAFCVVVGLLAVAGVAARHTHTQKKKHRQFFLQEMNKRESVFGSCKKKPNRPNVGSIQTTVTNSSSVQR